MWHNVNNVINLKN